MSKKNTTVQVTAEDIVKGVPGNCTRCMVARAVRRVAPIKGLGVDGTHILYREQGTVSAKLSKRVQRKIGKFDSFGEDIKNIRGAARLQKLKPFTVSVPNSFLAAAKKASSTFETTLRRERLQRQLSRLSAGASY